MAYDYILHNFEYCRNKCSNYSHDEQQCKNKVKIFIRSLVMQLVSEQIKRHAKISMGVHKLLHLKLHQFQTQIEGNSYNNIGITPWTSRKRCVRCYASKMSHLSKYFCQCCEKCLCLEHSNIVCDDSYKCFARPAIEDSD